MKISEIKPNQGGVNIEAAVIEMEPPKEFDKYGRKLKLSNAILQDESGRVKLTLWNAEIDKIKAGDNVRITNGFAKEYKGEIQLTAGKFGKIEVIGKADTSALPKAEEVPGKIEVDDSELYEEDDEW